MKKIIYYTVLIVTACLTINCRQQTSTNTTASKQTNEAIKQIEETAKPIIIPAPADIPKQIGSYQLTGDVKLITDPVDKNKMIHVVYKSSDGKIMHCGESDLASPEAANIKVKDYITSFSPATQVMDKTGKKVIGMQVFYEISTDEKTMLWSVDKKFWNCTTTVDKKTLEDFVKDWQIKSQNN